MLRRLWLRRGFIWLGQASATVQKAQWRLTVQLVNWMVAVNADSGQLMQGLLPTNLHDDVEAKVS